VRLLARQSAQTTVTEPLPSSSSVLTTPPSPQSARCDRDLADLRLPLFRAGLMHAGAAGIHGHGFDSATATLAVGSTDKLFAYVYLDPANPPSTIMLMWTDSTGNSAHRAYWGANLIPWGTNGTASQFPVGPLPALGQWVRLEVPASSVGLAGATIQGMRFTLYGGRASWDIAGKSN
jgi:hypothetical protein